jgi:hypothetical protein
VRAMFTMIEGSVFNLKQIALALSKHGKGSFSQASMIKVQRSHRLNSSPCLRTSKFAFLSAARAFGVAYELKVDDGGWNGFKDALVIRNRITHPKSIDDLQLSDNEIQTVADAAEWFLKVQRELIQKMMTKMEALRESKLLLVQFVSSPETKSKE